MRFIALVFSFLVFLYGESAYGMLYSCEIFNEKIKINTLTGELASNAHTDPNLALAFTLCQQAGLKPVNVMILVTGISVPIKKNQLLPNPACTLKCSPL